MKKALVEGRRWKAMRWGEVDWAAGHGRVWVAQGLDGVQEVEVEAMRASGGSMPASSGAADMSCVWYRSPTIHNNNPVKEKAKIVKGVFGPRWASGTPKGVQALRTIFGLNNQD
jgi:hypothetical protein